MATSAYNVSGPVGFGGRSVFLALDQCMAKPKMLRKGELVHNCPRDQMQILAFAPNLNSSRITSQRFVRQGSILLSVTRGQSQTGCGEFHGG